MSTTAIIITFIGLILFVVIIYIYKIQPTKRADLPENREVNDNYKIPNIIKLTNDYSIQINQTEETDEINNFPEITNPKLLKRINTLVPHVIDTSRSVTQTQQLINAGKQIKNFNANIPKNVMEVIIPPNAKLHNSKAIEGAYRGSYTYNRQLH